MNPENANYNWRSLLNKVIGRGRKFSPRDQGTQELLGQQTCTEMSQCVITYKARKLGYKFMAAEAAWIMYGDNRVHTIAPFSREISKFSDDGRVFFGAYGPPIRDQRRHVLHALAKDPETRQAVMTIWRPNPPPSLDIPCTVALQWMIRDEQLHCFATMRSSDIWLGWPYDVVNFSMLSLGIMLDLRDVCPVKSLGNLYLTAASQHLYDWDLPNARRVLASAEHVDVYGPNDLIEMGCKSWDDVAYQLEHLARYGKGMLRLKKIPGLKKVSEHV